MIGANYLGRMGQLGNQMFQFAAVKGIARKHGYEFMIPEYRGVVVDGRGNRLRYELDRPFTPQMDHIGVLPTDNYLQEPHFHYSQEFVDNFPDNASIVGYFQSPKYFERIADEIRQDFTFKDEIRDPCAAISENLDQPIALHVRRGDFITNVESHHNQSLDYYKDALGHFDDDRQVVIFSDDTQWCKEQELFQPGRFLISGGGSPDIDMCLMSMCHSFVIANSTFSWWSAWLSTNEDKKVIYPKLWFGITGYTKDYNVEDLFPDGWITL